MELIQEVGAFAGLAAFIGLAVLALLYFAQARDVRRLRENAEFLVEGEFQMPPAGATEVPEPAAEPKAAARAAAASAPTDAEAFRRAELARQAAERRQRFERRRKSDDDGTGRTGRLPSNAVIIVGALILIAGIAFGATRFLGGDQQSTSSDGGGSKAAACPPGQTKVAVLNGTAEAGLAASSVPQLKQKGYEVNPVTNTESGFDTSTLMFDRGGEQCVAEIAAVVGIEGSQPMDQEVRGISEGAVVAVILGEDRVTGAAASGASTDATSP
jgi:hypothetical protein